MRRLNMLLMLATILLNILTLSGCWNYREVDQLAVVAGAAIDKGKSGGYSLTVEIVEISGGRESETKSKTLTFEGKSIFDAARNAIAFIGKKLYWSHAKVVVISREVAEEGLLEVLDWYNRDAETRADIHILVSKGSTAKEILSTKGATEKVKSFEMDKMIDNQWSLSKTPTVEIWRLTNNLTERGVGAVTAAIELKGSDGEILPVLMGTAVFKEDSLIGFLDPDETRGLLYVRNWVKGGVIVEDLEMDNGSVNVTLEIFKSKTRVEPIVNNGIIKMKVGIETTTAIDEIEGTLNVIEDEGRNKLKEAAEQSIKTRIENTVKKAQDEFGVDIFSFGAKLNEENPRVWNTIKDQWRERFKDIKVDVEVKVHIKNSAMMSEPLEIGG